MKIDFCIRILMIIVLINIVGCSVEEEIIKHDSSLDKNAITFKQFKNETKIKNFQAFKSLKASSKMATEIESKYVTDTTKILKLAKKNKTTYSFKVYPITEQFESNVYYNLVYEKTVSGLNEIIFKNTEKKDLKTNNFMLQSSDMIYNSKFLSKSKSSTGNRIATSISNFGFCETIIYSFSCTCEDKSNCDQCSECVSVSVSYEYCGNGGSGDVGSGDSGDINIGFGSGGEDSGIYIPNPYTGDADLNNPDFALAIQVSDFVETITNSNFALKSLMEDNSWLYPNIVQFMRDNGHEVSQVNKDAVVFALTNVIPVFKLNLPDWTFTNINLFHYDSFNLLLQSQENVNFTNQIVTKIQQNPTLYTSTKPFVIEKQINDTQLNPCLKGIMEKLKMATNSDIANVMAKLDATNEYNLTMKMGTVKPGNYAATTKVSKNNYLVTVTQNDFTTASKLYRATSLLHETIHAFMLSVVDDYNTYPTNAPFTDFPELFKIYVSKINNVDNAEIAQHEDMANKYVDAIASALEEYQTSTTGIPSSLADKQVFLDMAWSGLQNTDVFDTKFPLGSANRTRILARIGAELNGVYSQGQYAVGKPCN